VVDDSASPKVPKKGGKKPSGVMGEQKKTKRRDELFF